MFHQPIIKTKVTSSGSQIIYFKTKESPQEKKKYSVGEMFGNNALSKK